MDLLMKCAHNYQKLMSYEYRFTLGRKGKLTKIVLRFSDTDFHHLAGLHKLKDTGIARANRSTVFQKILDGSLTYDTITKSEFLLKMGNETILGITFLFLDQSEQGIYFCRSFFPMERTDYTKGQMQFTLLKKEKYNLKTKQTLTQYDRLCPQKNQ